MDMRAEDLKGWIMEAKHEKDPVRRRWELVVRLVQLVFLGGTMLKEITWVTMVLLPKGRGGGIRGLVLWRSCGRCA